MASIAGNDRAAGQIYNVAGREITSILGAVQMMARAVGVRPDIVNVPLDIARAQRAPLVHWGEGLVGGMFFSIDKALADLDWTPRFGVEDGYRRLLRVVRRRRPGPLRVRLQRRRRRARRARPLTVLGERPGPVADPSTVRAGANHVGGRAGELQRVANRCAPMRVNCRTPSSMGASRSRARSSS